jgi:glycosyltransferase involved in cell wall biosynthesis
MGERRVLYVQYANPGMYPPVERGARILAEHGWTVVLLGIGALGAANQLQVRPHPRLRVKLLKYAAPGWRQKVHYLTYVAFVAWWVLTWRPQVVYCSDTLAAPVGLLMYWLFRVRVCYHEHDSPTAPPSLLTRICLGGRRRLARVARVCVIPSAARAARFAAALRPRKLVCVWNCPSCDEILEWSPRSPDGCFRLWYHGSLSPPLLTVAVIRALAKLPPLVSLQFAGYETIGHLGYAEKLLALALELNIAERVEFLGPLNRHELYARAAQADLGLALFSRQFHEPLAGASNKPFDYLACGLAVLVPDAEEWRSLLETPGYARSCDPEAPDAIAAAVRWFLDRPQARLAMAEAGRQRLLDDWNYEAQFEPVRRLLESQRP